MRGLLTLLMVGGLLSFLNFHSPAQQPPGDAAKGVQDKRPRVDAYGDPIPEGAVARLGALRFRHVGEIATRAMAFSPDDKILAAMTSAGIILWDADNGKEVRRFKEGGSGAIAFSPDSKFLAVNCGPILLFEIATGRELFNSPQVGLRSSMSEQICYSPDSKLIAASYMCDFPNQKHGSMLKILNAHTGEDLFDLRSPLTSCGLAFTPDSKTLAVDSTTGIRLFAVTSGKWLREIQLPDDKTFNPIAFSPDGRTLARGTKDGAELIEVATGTVRTTVEADAGLTYSVAFTPDGGTLVAYSSRDKVYIWDVHRPEKRQEWSGELGYARAAALSHDGKTLAVGSGYPSSVQLWDVATGLEKLASFQRTFGEMNSVAYSPDGKHVVTGAGNRHVHLWDAATGAHLRQFKGGSAKRVAFSANGTLLAAAGWEVNRAGTPAQIWNAINGELELQLPRLLPHEEFHSIAFFPDGKRLLTGNFNYPPKLPDDPLVGPTVQLWNALDGKRLARQSLGSLFPTSVAVSPDGRTAAVGGHSMFKPDTRKQVLRLLDMNAKGKAIHLMGHESGVNSIAFSPSGRFLASAGDDKTVRLWEVNTAGEVMRIKLDYEPTAVAFSPCGRFLASGTVLRSSKDKPQVQEGRIRIWSAFTGIELAAFTGHGSGVTSLAFSPDGSRLVTGHGNGTALIWDVSSLKTNP